MKVLNTPLPPVVLFELDHFKDDRGWFAELWKADRYREHGLDVTFVQSNVSLSRRGVLRGLHYQSPDPQGKLVTVLAGVVYDVVVDIRAGSSTFGAWYGAELSQANRRQLWVPEGFAHGFLTLSDEALVSYQCTVAYNPAADRSLAWDDPEVGIEWPERPVTVSEKDAAAPRLRALHV